LEIAQPSEVPKADIGNDGSQRSRRRSLARQTAAGICLGNAWLADASVIAGNVHVLKAGHPLEMFQPGIRH
jgi:hypothetical protein